MCCWRSCRQVQGNTYVFDQVRLPEVHHVSTPDTTAEGDEMNECVLCGGEVSNIHRKPRVHDHCRLGFEDRLDSMYHDEGLSRSEVSLLFFHCTRLLMTLHLPVPDSERQANDESVAP